MELSDLNVASDGSATQPTRRDFLYLATGAMGLVAAGATMVPLIDQMNPDASTIAAGGPVDVDLAKLAPGQNIIVRWRAHPIFVLKRPEKLLETLQKPSLVAMLSDPNSDQHQQPPYAKNWHRSIKPEFLVVVGICTHLGCIPRAFPQASATTPTANWPGGYFCPCHGSKYDLAARVFKGVPAPLNLPVPQHRYLSDTILRIGENPPGVSFDLASVEQL
ncbi:MAG: ubiquinol-cytochrome c reductase iron-sulfur subunit [Methylovirgula sp.]